MTNKTQIFGNVQILSKLFNFGVWIFFQNMNWCKLTVKKDKCAWQDLGGKKVPACSIVYGHGEKFKW